MKAKNSSRTQLIRRLVQLGFALFILVTAARHGLGGEEAGVPSTDALCPFGGLETLWRFVVSGSYIPKTHASNIVLGLGLLVGTVLAGGAFCGWICPLGGLQDLLTGLRRRLRVPELRVPEKADRVLGYGRYLVLAGILYATISTAKLWFASYDPYRTIFSLGWLFEFNWAESWPAYVTSLVIIAGSFLVPRLWCRYLCPLGGTLSLLSRISLFRIRRDANTCIDCKKCDKTCPARIKVSEKRSVTADCIGCLQCVETCPVPGTLYVGTIGGGSPAVEPKEGVA